MNRLRLLPVVLLLLGSAAACGRGGQPAADHSDPAAALGSIIPSKRYGLTFWVEQQHKKTRLWREALAFCSGKDPASYPNCETIRVVLFIESPPPFPKPTALPDPAAPEATR